MKKLVVLAFGLLAASSHAIIFPTGMFPAGPNFQESFDSIAVGTYNALPVFGVPAVMSRIGITGGLVVRPFVGANTVPNILYGDGVDVRIVSTIPMRRFGGFFRTGVNGFIAPTVTLRFYDVFNNPIGQSTIPVTTTMQWIGFQTFPKWRRVDILGGFPGIPGAIGMDSLRIRPN